MISANSIDFFSDEAMKKIADVIEKVEKKKVVGIYMTEKDANIIAKQLRLQGYDKKVIQQNNAYKVIANMLEHIKYDEAMKSGQFKKLAWNRFSFERKANENLGYEEYPFDEGTIWKVVKDENGVEYLVKEVEDEDEDKVIRTKVANIMNSNQLINEKNMNRAIEAFYGTLNKEFILDMAPAKSAMVQVLNDKLDKIVQAELDGNKFISSPDYKDIVKEHVVKNLHELHGRTQVAALISRFNQNYIATIGKSR